MHVQGKHKHAHNRVGVRTHATNMGLGRDAAQTRQGGLSPEHVPAEATCPDLSV